MNNDNAILGWSGNTIFPTYKQIEDNMWKNALRLMPRGTQTMSKCPDQFVDGVYPKFATSAKGAYITTYDGNEYLDFACGLGPIILGYNHKRTNDAIKNQLERGIIFSLPTSLEQELAEIIHGVVPCAEQVRFAKNGSDSTLGAVRIARSFTKKEKIVKCGYHGWGDWHAISMRPYGVPTCLKGLIDEFKYNDIDSLSNLLKNKDVAAVILEPQALTKPNTDFLEQVKEMTHHYGALLIFDEVVTGFRWALGGAQSLYKVIPDIACLGKAMGNGMPISAVAGRADIMNEFNHVFYSMTFGGECLSIAAAIETITELKQKDYSQIWELGDLLSLGINDAAQKCGLKVNFAGSAPRHNLTFDESYKDASGMKDLFYQEMVKQGILFSNVIYIQFSHTAEDILKTITAAKKAFAFVNEHQNEVDKVLEGKRSVAIFRKNT